MYDNQLTGTIPTELGQLTSLEDPAMSENQLNGTIPTELGQLIEDLTMRENLLTGTIPADPAGLGNMTYAFF
jgi:hypothetical protein